MAGFTTPDNTLMALLATSTDALRLDPHNELLRTGILQNQVKLTQNQLGITQLQAAHVVRSFTNTYAYSKGYDPKAVMDALTSAQQQILDYDKNKPTLYGMDLVAANKVASYFAASAGVVLALSIIAFAIALFMIGPEAAAAIAATGGVVEAIGAITGVAVGSTGGTALAIGTFLFLISQMLGHMASSIPMWTKQMVDNGTIAASLQITAIKNVADVQAQLSGTKAPGPYDSAQFSSLLNGLLAAGFTQVKNPLTNELAPLNQQTLAQLINYLYGTQIGIGAPATPSKITPLINPWLFKGGSNNPIPLSLYDQVLGMTAAPVVTSGSGTGGGGAITQTPSSASSTPSVSVPNLQIFTGVISGGTLGLPQEFHASPAAMISNIEQLTQSAKINLAAAVVSLPGRFYYEIAIVSTIKTKSGLTQKGAPVQIITGYYKNGQPKKKTVYYKFGVMKLGVTDENGRNVHLATINLGPVDTTAFSPSNVQLQNVQNTISSSTFTTDITNISQVVSPTPPTTTSTVPPNPNQAALDAAAAAAAATPQNTTGVDFATSQKFTYTPRDYFVERDGFFGSIFYREGTSQYQTYPSNDMISEGLIQNVVGAGNQWGEVKTYLASLGINIDSFRHEAWPFEFPVGRPIQSIQKKWRDFFGASTQSVITPTFITNATTTQKTAAAGTSTLFEFYTALNAPLPPLSTRASLYEAAGLGPAATYVGSADQNNKLLGWLKAH